jgi:acyl-CoA synthetase (AMP-forming)/AMP-acid ligase II
MILTNPRGLPASARIGARVTLDELLRRTAQRRPDAVALIDPPNRESFTGGRPRSLTYAQADHMVSAIAGRLRRMGLYTDAVVGIQVTNTVVAC